MIQKHALNNQMVQSEELLNREAPSTPAVPACPTCGRPLVEHGERQGGPLPSDVTPPTPTKPAKVEPGA
jgi:hypothetical protein